MQQDIRASPQFRNIGGFRLSKYDWNPRSNCRFSPEHASKNFDFQSTRKEKSGGNFESGHHWYTTDSQISGI